LKIGVIGAAGTVGSSCAFNIVAQHLADELILIDRNEDVLISNWMDLNSASTGKDMLIRKGVYEDLDGADIVVMAAGVSHNLVSGKAAMFPINAVTVTETTTAINRYCPEAVVITETNPVDSTNYLTFLLSKSQDRRKYIGYTYNDSMRFRQNAAQALGLGASRLQGMVMGEHGSHQALLFSTLKLDGQPLQVDPGIKKALYEDLPLIIQRYESLKFKRTAGWTCAVGTAAVIRAIKNNSRELIPSGTVLTGEYGYEHISLTAPTLIGKNGIEEIQKLELAADEEERLAEAVQAISPWARKVEEMAKKPG
jgi:malate/lactate dehydrogenase